MARRRSRRSSAFADGRTRASFFTYSCVRFERSDDRPGTTGQPALPEVGLDAPDEGLAVLGVVADPPSPPPDDPPPAPEPDVSVVLAALSLLVVFEPEPESVL